MNRVCAGCGDPIDHMSGGARFCGSTCRATATKRRSRGLGESGAVAVGLRTDGPVHAAILRELEATGRAGTSQGALCLAMAARIDARADTGASLAALTRQLSESMARDAPHVRDLLDDLRDRRAARFVP